MAAHLNEEKTCIVTICSYISLINYKERLEFSLLLIFFPPFLYIFTLIHYVYGHENQQE